MAVYRVYVEKRKAYAGEARHLLQELRGTLGVVGLSGLRVLNRYDVEGVSKELFDQCVQFVFSEPQLDTVYFELPKGAAYLFATEYLPGQFDQRADSAAECIQLISQDVRPTVKSAKVYLFEGELGEGDYQKLKQYLINPVEAREAELGEALTLQSPFAPPPMVEMIEGFRSITRSNGADCLRKYGLAMDLDDLLFCVAYFRKEGRDPSVTELRVIDTYWSDHCRHTTFGTHLDAVEIEDPAAEKTYHTYQKLRHKLYQGKEKPICLMDLATIGAKYLKKKGKLRDLDESEEINACSVKLKVDVDGRDEDWLLLFKNETHNHPTEIEPFGGAATCIGGAIRDPLSGRAYVYQAMRVTGAGDPLAPLSETLPGKLPQRKLVTTAAQGYSSYGNQIGLATGLVHEFYHPGYTAKRMEIGAVVGAAPARNVHRSEPKPGDLVILLGGRTGRDGCGGATGSSKAHKKESLETCGAEVQKGNAPIERKLQRLFRNGDVTRLIKRCNDFGAGGVSVAIGELADGLAIDLDAVPKKYEGLDGTELAISESQERMAVVIAREDGPAFLAAARAENLEATQVAVVTEAPRLVMEWRGQKIVDISRAFLGTNGAEKHRTAFIPKREKGNPEVAKASLEERLLRLVGDLNHCSQKGLVERFDSTIGAGTVVMPFGGKYQLTPAQAMVAKLPVLSGETSTCSGMAFGFDPYVSEADPYKGAYLAVVESVTKLVASGFRNEKVHLTFQEYFERLGSEPSRWGKPLAALLGALQAQLDLEVAAIGGKDSMSGSFEKLDVPPTLVSFAIAAGKVGQVVTPELKLPGSHLCLLTPAYDDNGLPEPESLKVLYGHALDLMGSGKVLSCFAPTSGGVAEALLLMGLGNRLGVKLSDAVSDALLFEPRPGSLLLELVEPLPVGLPIGETTLAYQLVRGAEQVDLNAVQKVYEGVLEPVFPYHTGEGAAVEKLSAPAPERRAPAVQVAVPRALIPVFPGTNCEYDTARALEKAGAKADVFVLNNLTPAAVTESVQAMRRKLGQCQLVVLPGGFSGGDEPDGSGKLITAFFRNPAIAEGVEELLTKRDGLMLGICNGFQALIKLGLLPFGKITETGENCPTLTFNTIGRHQSTLVRTRVASTLSPWLQYSQVGEVYTVPVSHGEGRFVASEEMVKELIAGGQIATQYVNEKGEPTMDIRFNPNGSLLAVEAITSPDGRVLGKMGHSERWGQGLYQNVSGHYDQQLFQGGVDYFRL